MNRDELTPTQEAQLKMLAIEMEMEDSLFTLNEGNLSSTQCNLDVANIRLLRRQILAILQSKPVKVEDLLKSVDSLETKVNYYKRDALQRGFVITKEIEKFIEEQYEFIDKVKTILKR